MTPKKAGRRRVVNIISAPRRTGATVIVKEVPTYLVTPWQGRE